MEAKLDLNCDLGEGESLAQTKELMSWVTSVNVACSGHAGTVGSMSACVEAARAAGVHVGAHPGYGQSGGRGDISISPEEFELLLLQQVSGFERICRLHQTALHHIKLHGTLYHLSETDDRLRDCYVDAFGRWWPEVILYARAGGGLAAAARARGLQVWEEAFADRAYNEDGSLVSRGLPGSLLEDVDAVVQRVLNIARAEPIRTVRGERLDLKAQTICVHSDTPNAARLVREIAEALGLPIRPGISDAHD